MGQFVGKASYFQEVTFRYRVARLEAQLRVGLLGHVNPVRTIADESVPHAIRKRESKALSTPEWIDTLAAVARLKKGSAVEVQFSAETLTKITPFQFRRVLRAHLSDPQLRFELHEGRLYIRRK